MAKRTLHLHITYERADIDSIDFYAWPTKASTTLEKDLQSLPTQTGVTFHAGHAESTSPLNSENWVHELLIPQVQYYPPAPTNMKKHLKVTSDEEKLVSSRFASGSWSITVSGIARYSRRTCSQRSLWNSSRRTRTNTVRRVSCIFRDGESIGEDGFLARSTKADEKFKYRLYTARNNCYNRRRATKLRRAKSSIHHENNRTGRNCGRWRKQAKFGVFFGVLFSTFSQPLQVCIFSTKFEAAPRRPEVPTIERDKQKNHVSPGWVWHTNRFCYNRPFAQLWPGNEVRGIAGQNRLRCVCFSFELSFFFYFGMSFSDQCCVPRCSNRDMASPSLLSHI